MLQIFIACSAVLTILAFLPDHVPEKEAVELRPFPIADFSGFVDCDR